MLTLHEEVAGELAGGESFDLDTAEAMACGMPEGDYAFVASQEVSKHRWYTKRLVVFRHADALLGFLYLDPATEEQEGQDRFEADPVPTFPVVGREVTTTTYERGGGLDG